VTGDAGRGPRATVRVAVLLTALGVLALAHDLAVTAFSGRTRPPEERLRAARRTLEAPLTRAASRWAPEELQEATTLLAEAVAEYERQRQTLWPRRDFSAAAGRLWEAEVRGRRALMLGEERLVTARTGAADAVEEAEGLLNAAEALVTATTLPHEERVHLARARFIVSEAQSLLGAEEYALAAERAEAGRVELEHALGPALARARRYTSAEQVRTWKRWIAETVAWSRASGRTAVVVLKERNELRLIDRGQAVRRYPVDIGSNAMGRKLRAGDRATPEGRYRVVARKGHGRTRYHKALLLDYPNDTDRRRHAEARRAGEIPRGAQPGGLIEIHGDGGRGRNWTDGCVALSNDHMDELFAHLQVGSWVTIVGGDGGNGTFSDLVGRLNAEGNAR